MPTKDSLMGNKESVKTASEQGLGASIGATNYYDDWRISQSALKTYRRCPSLYKAIYIDKIYKYPQTDSFTIGKAVDCIVTEGYEAFGEQFEIVKRRTKDAEKEQLTVTMFNHVDNLVNQVIRHPVMELVEKLEPQKELYTKTCKGKLDWFGINRRICTIVDLKTTSDLEKIRYSVEDYGYRFQMAFYRMLAKETYGKRINRFKIYLAVVDKTSKYKFGFYEMDQRSFISEEKEIKFLMDHMKNNLGYTKRFKKGICYECPPEIKCPWSFVTKNNIEKI